MVIQNGHPIKWCLVDITYHVNIQLNIYLSTWTHSVLITVVAKKKKKNLIAAPLLSTFFFVTATLNLWLFKQTTRNS